MKEVKTAKAVETEEVRVDVVAEGSEEVAGQEVVEEMEQAERAELVAWVETVAVKEVG